uniref:Uncharacterized protein n=1 Tax=Sphaerodactylus townsendi TaxID=933632 RepID=A0ACB8F3Y1_9SAUR
MLADEMIRDQLVEKMNIPRVRERLLLESELSLGKAMVIANQIEAVLSEVDMMHPGTGGGIEKVELLQKAPKLTQDTTKELKKLVCCIKTDGSEWMCLASQNKVNLPQRVALAVTRDNLTQEVGCAVEFTHKVKVRPNLVPVQQELQRLPFAVRDAVSEEHKKLVQKDIIEEVESSEWISPIVVVRKKDGNI